MAPLTSEQPTMTTTRDNDNDDSIFHFDPYSNLSSPEVCFAEHGNVSDLAEYLSHGGLIVTAGKGKEITRPLPIQPMRSNDTDFGSVFSAGSPAESSNLSPLASSPSSQLSISPPNFASERNPEIETRDLYPQLYHNLGNGKGKEREAPPFFTSPVFNLAGLDHESLEHSVWSPLTSSTPGPSNHSSPLYPAASLGTPSSGLTHSAPISTQHSQHDLFTSKHMPSRRHSASNLSTKSQSMLRAKLKWSVPRLQHNLSRAFSFKKRDAAKAQTGSITDLPDPVVAVFDPLVLQYPNDVFPREQLDGFPGASTDQLLLRTKDRSNSLPEPLSALDYIPTSSLDIYEPIPLVIRNYFDDELPRELRVRVFRSLVELHEWDFQRMVANGKWTTSKASSSKGQWVGRAKGIKELFKLSRVSKSWQRLAFDGQLWGFLDLREFPTLPESALLRLSEFGCSFIRGLNIAGHNQIHASTLINIADNLCIPPRIMTCTRLTSIILQGCASITTRSLHHLLILSESLQTLNVKGLSAVTNATCDILAIYCPLMTNLNMSRCPNIDADGIRCMASTALRRGKHLRLKSLRVSGLKNVSDSMMSALGKAAPYLEVLDLSYARQVHNSAIEAFVTCDPNDTAEVLGVEIITLSAREAGRENGNRDYYRRRVTHLRHLSLSCCILLTDMACSNLAYSVPHLEFFEMAGINADLKDDGLIRLFRTTPHIRRIDLEDASDITDRVLEAITPYVDPDELLTVKTPEATPMPGQALEYLILSHASQVSDEALLSLIRNCPRLKRLEADNTRMGATVLREFVQLTRERNTSNATIVAVDCRGISDSVMKELSESIRPRMGWRSHAARKLMYLDAQDDSFEELKVGQDECDEKRVVVKSFYSWQIVDSVHAAREKRRRATKRVTSDSSDCEDSSWRTRWWSPSGRRLPNSGRDTPQGSTDINGNDGCLLM